ncbi:MAG: hypothetical protein LBD98_00620 [Endomicrobium sp.]|jgi:hypothetical protein|nr:hypothetical protein [Endomicrobium sp.]
MDKNFILLFLTIVFCSNFFVFAAENKSSRSLVKVTVLEDPYKSARQNETKYIDISDNLSTIYRKAHIIRSNFELKKIVEIFKRIVEKIKVFLVKIKLLKA